MRPDDFGLMRPGEYWAVVEAYVDAENGRLILISDSIRRLALTIVSFFGNKKRTKLTDVWKMPWDEWGKKTVEIPTDKETVKSQIQKLMKQVYGG